MSSDQNSADASEKASVGHIVPLIPERRTREVLLTPQSTLLDTDQAASILGFAPKTLAKDRCTREIGIPFVKLGRSCRYRLSDLEKFIADRVVS